jgi:hypothetical protein
MEVSQKTKIDLQYDSLTPLLGMYLKTILFLKKKGV